VAAVLIRLHAELRSRWRAWLALAVLAGVAGGLVLATAAGARRTDSALERHRDAIESVDVWVARGDFFGLDVDFSRVERLPQVAQSSRSIDLAFWARTDKGRAVTNGEVELGLPTEGRDPAANRPMLLAGRAPDPAAADEIFVGSLAADYYDLRVGSTLRVRFATKRELAKIAETGKHDERADPETAGVGPLLTLRVVGIRADLQSEDGLMYITMSPAFYETHGRRVGAWIELSGIRLKRGDADLAAFRAGVQRIADGKPFELYPKRNIQAKLQNSIHIQARALWVLAALGGVAALLLVGQALTRQIALESSEHPLLRSLGMTRRQLFALGLARIAPVGLAAGALAAGVAVALSPLAPIGVARTAEPDPGLALDSLVVVGGGVAIAALVLLAALVPAWRAARAHVEHGRPRSSPAVGLLARAGFPPSSVAGVRMALEPGRGRTAVPVRSTLVAAIVGVAAIAAALTITASADRLLSTPRLYGHNWDAVIGNGSEPRYPERFVAGLRADRSIAQLAAATHREARVEGQPTGVLGIDSIRGSLSPTVLEGRAPAAPGEILLGTKTAGALAAEIGDEVEAGVGDRAGALRVVGLGVLPEVSIASGLAPLALGEGAAMTFEGLRRLDSAAQRNIFLLDLAAGAEGQATLARLERDASAAVPSRPAEVGNWGRVSAFPYVLAALIAAAATAILAHALVTSIRRRRRDLAILKTLGFERGDVQATVAWQASTVAAIGLLVGLPLGVGIGRFVWNLFAQELGVLSEPVAPVWPGLLVIPATLLLANLVALLPGRIAAGTPPATVLRAE
jgi:ABC-type lipoprotein release transport system permease subunit